MPGDCLSVKYTVEYMTKCEMNNTQIFAQYYVLFVSTWNWNGTCNLLREMGGKRQLRNV